MTNPCPTRIPNILLPRFKKSSLIHFELYHHLKSIYVAEESVIEIEPLRCYAINKAFESKRQQFLPHEDEFTFRDPSFKALFNYYLSQNKYSNDYIFKSLTCRDKDVIENQQFRYTIFTPSQAIRAREVIFLFHGLNEKYLHKSVYFCNSIML